MTMLVKWQSKWQWIVYYLTNQFTSLNIMSDFKFRTLSITEAEETALVEIIKYFNDMGLPENVNFDDYDSLSDKVCEPAFWEYN